MEQEQDIEEYKALTSCLSSFYEYGNWARKTVLKPKTDKYDSLPAQDQALLPWYKDYLQQLSARISANELFLQRMAVEVAPDWGVIADPTQWYRCTYQDLDKVRSTLRQLVREWSVEGSQERAVSFKRIVDECETWFGVQRPKKELEVLVTGSGLGRLVLEFVDRGYNCQGNEFSYHMLLMSNYMLNHMRGPEEHEVFPFIHKVSHAVNRSQVLRGVKIPDFNPLDIFRDPAEGKGELMSMCAGSFTDLYGPADLMQSETYTADEKAVQFRDYNKEKFDVVVTCFFLDTASNIVDYLKTIAHCLKSGGGIWVNFGPLLWHFEDDDGSSKVNGREVGLKGLELTREDLHELCETMGFEFVKYENGIKTAYAGDINSLGEFTYKCEYWVCRRK